MIEEDLDINLLAEFRSARPGPDEETLNRVYRYATRPKNPWRLFQLQPRRRSAAIVVSAALVLVPTALAVGKIVGLFEGTPAPPSITADFAAQNQVANMAIQRGFAAKFPLADVTKAHGVLQIVTASGPEDLWTAPNSHGGQCWFVDFANDQPTPTGRFGFGGCDGPITTATPRIDLSVVWTRSHPALVTVIGRAYAASTNVRLRFTDGTTLTLPVIERFFLGSAKKGTRIEHATLYNNKGKPVASWTQRK